MTELTPSEAENPLSGYGKTISHVIVGLKTVKGTKQLRLDPSIYEAILKEKIVVGDVIYVEANTGAVKVCVCLCGEGVVFAEWYNVACRTIGRLCLLIRSRIGDLRPPPKRRCPQTQGARARRHLRRSRRRERATPGWTGYHERHGELGEERENGGDG